MKKTQWLWMILGTILVGLIFARVVNASDTIAVVSVPVITPGNNIPYAYVGLTHPSSTGTINCLTQEYVVYSGGKVEIQFSNVKPACRTSTQFTLSAAGPTHVKYDKTTILNVPATCTIVPNGADVAISCTE